MKTSQESWEWTFQTNVKRQGWGPGRGGVVITSDYSQKVSYETAFKKSQY